MRQINKQEEPIDFIKWKTANQLAITHLENEKGDKLWDLLPSSLSKEVVENDYSKELLRQSLVKEQYYLCCYCNASIKGAPLDTKVEHFLPKEKHKHKAFVYQNLLAACNGGERVSPVELSCDSRKGDKDPLEYDIISPLVENVEAHFSYKEDGKIVGKTEQGKNTIQFLNLDCKRLILSRKAVIEEYLYDETNDIQLLISELAYPIEGKLQAFCIAIATVLAQYR